MKVIMVDIWGKHLMGEIYALQVRADVGTAPNKMSRALREGHWSRMNTNAAPLGPW